MNKLPNELLTVIFEHLSNKDKYNCLFVCKYWFNTIQIILYKEISIDIGFTDNIFDNLMFDTLVNSSFSPGRWVKKITVQRLKVPDNNDFSQLDPTTDPLHLLITHCPSVDQFCFQHSNYIFDTEWSYLQHVLYQKRHDWHLRNIAEHFDKQDYLRYYACASIMKNSLSDFHLKQKVQDYPLHFKGFARLENLFIGRHVINDIVECDAIIKTLPHLESLDIDFHVLKSHEIGRNKYKLMDHYNTFTPFKNIKNLRLKNFPISKDLDLIFIINTFTHLVNLKIKVAKSKPWPISKINTKVIQDFFGFICTLPHYSVIFKDIDIITLMNLYYSSKIIQSEKLIPFDLSFTNILDQSENSVSLEATNENNDQKNKLKLIYNLAGTTIHQRMEKAKRTLGSIEHHIKEIHVSLLGKHSIAKRIDEFMPIIFDSCHGLIKVTFYGGELSCNMTNKRMQKQSNDIIDLIFDKSHLDPNGITLVSNCFPCIKSFQLNNCTFMNNQCIDNAVIINIDMFHTDFYHIQISFKEIGMPGVTRPADKHEFCAQPVQIMKSYLFIVINFGHDQTTEYYGGNILIGTIQKVKRNLYYHYLDQCGETNQNQLNVYCLNVKSLRRLDFITPKQNIELKFP